MSMYMPRVSRHLSLSSYPSILEWWNFIRSTKLGKGGRGNHGPSPSSLAQNLATDWGGSRGLHGSCVSVETLGKHYSRSFICESAIRLVLTNRAHILGQF